MTRATALPKQWACRLQDDGNKKQTRQERRVNRKEIQQAERKLAMGFMYDRPPGLVLPGEEVRLRPRASVKQSRMQTRSCRWSQPSIRRIEKPGRKGCRY